MHGYDYCLAEILEAYAHEKGWDLLRALMEYECDAEFRRCIVELIHNKATGHNEYRVSLVPWQNVGESRELAHRSF